jgi:hypothetical protein
MPAAGDQTAEERGSSGVLVDVERLRIELARELDDLLTRDLLPPELELVALADVFEVEDPATLHRHSAYGRRHRCDVRCAREVDANRRPRSRLALDADRAAALLHDREHGR